ncbi:MAG: MAPEG family protein [Hyphomicrobiales bacterium]|nr:MAPEG family protein [Hyphomicrobiales bacterium]
MTMALWCVLVAGILPVVAAGIAKWGTVLDNNHPRDWANSLGGYRRRAYAAHHNAYEAFPFFAAAVIVANITDAPQGMVNILAIVFIAARIGYTAAYMADLSTPRSILWAVGWFATIAIFSAGAWA